MNLLPFEEFDSVWLAYCAMATALVPLVFMGIGYLFLGKRKEKGS